VTNTYSKSQNNSHAWHFGVTISILCYNKFSLYRLGNHR